MFFLLLLLLGEKRIDVLWWPIQFLWSQRHSNKNIQRNKDARENDDEPFRVM